ncbi:MAG: hypothetical protein ABJD24_02935 [Acidimicrobiales bacterium]
MQTTLQVGSVLRSSWSFLCPSLSRPATPPIRTQRTSSFDEKIATEITGLTHAQQKRARFDGLLPFYRHRGHKVLYRVGDLYAYRDSMFVPTKRKPPITRTRTPEHNEKIGNAVKAARAKASKS